jgi:arsenate reductase
MNAHPIIGFSKTYDDSFNPSAFAAILTCSQADGACPFIAGAEKNPITKTQKHLITPTRRKKERSIKSLRTFLCILKIKK